MKRLAIILSKNHTLHEMMIGIVAANAVLALIALFTGDTRKALYGVLIGCMIAVVYVIHMAVTVDDALCLDEEGATASMRKHMIIRYVFVCTVVAITLYFGIANPVFLVISVITIKAGAYLQPAVHKILKW